MRGFARFLTSIRPLIVGLGLLVAVNLLPPDTSLREVRGRGLLRVCVPESFPPLVTGSPERPGIDVEILQRISEGLGVELSLLINAAIGQDFNPRNWRVNRAQCELLAGGVVASQLTRSFLETTPPHLETGWAVVIPPGVDSLEGSTVGFFAGVSGLDRISLSRYLRRAGARVRVVNSAQDLAEGLADGSFTLAVSEALSARQVASVGGYAVAWLPLGRLPIAFGLWKGDLTLKRALEREMQVLVRSGRLYDIVASYSDPALPILDRCAPCEGAVP